MPKGGAVLSTKLTRLAAETPDSPQPSDAVSAALAPLPVLLKLAERIDRDPVGRSTEEGVADG
jgi:hypothetical protein